MSKKVYIIAGEASGDLHASNLIKALKKSDSSIKCRGFGGDLMQQAGCELLKHYKDTAVMGVIDGIRHWKKIKRNLQACCQDILSYQPDLIILVDYPWFNLKVAQFAKEHHFKTAYYIAPKIWATREKRIKKIIQYIDKVYAILPFEPDYFKQNGYDKVLYIGNPLLDELETHSFDNNAFLSQQGWQDDKPIIALLPGSRKHEINLLLPVMRDVCQQFDGFRVVIAGAPSISPALYQKVLPENDYSVVFGKTYDLLHSAQVALVSSGTATLETALLKIPQIVCYKFPGGKLLYKTLKAILLKVKYASLVNLIMNKEVVKEYLQHECTVENVKDELKRLLHNKDYRANMLHEYDDLKNKVGASGASNKAAVDMISLFLST